MWPQWPNGKGSYVLYCIYKCSNIKTETKWNQNAVHTLQVTTECISGTICAVCLGLTETIGNLSLCISFAITPTSDENIYPWRTYVPYPLSHCPHPVRRSPIIKQSYLMWTVNIMLLSSCRLSYISYTITNTFVDFNPID